MAGYSLNPHREQFVSGKNILASEHVKFIEGGATLDASAIGAKTLPVGTAIARNTATGKFEEYADGQTGYDELHILNVDVQVDGENDVVVGEVIVFGSVYEAKLADNVTDAFKAEVKDRIRFVKHIEG